LATRNVGGSHEVLWDMEGEPGAVSTAAIVLNAKSEARFGGGK
jgi:hypothetical protein